MKMNNNDIQIILNRYNLKTESYKPGYVRLYAVFNTIDKKLSKYMTKKELCSWLEGYDQARDN